MAFQLAVAESSCQSPLERANFALFDLFGATSQSIFRHNKEDSRSKGVVKNRAGGDPASWRPARIVIQHAGRSRNDVQTRLVDRIHRAATIPPQRVWRNMKFGGAITITRIGRPVEQLQYCKVRVILCTCRPAALCGFGSAESHDTTYGPLRHRFDLLGWSDSQSPSFVPPHQGYGSSRRARPLEPVLRCLS